MTKVLFIQKKLCAGNKKGNKSYKKEEENIAPFNQKQQSCTVYPLIDIQQSIYRTGNDQHIQNKVE